MESFRRLGLSDKTIKVLEKKGYTEPTSIQAKAIPLLLEGKRDIVGQSQTGTGKTASFALPILERIKKNSKTVQAIILTPTRELALQVAKEFNSLKGDRDVDVLAVYGGSSISQQRQRLKSGVDIVVGTPGRVMDLQKRKSLVLDDIKYAVLDEADEMLSMGFVDDIESILKNTPKEKNMMLFSATMPKPILKIAQNYMHDYELIEVEKSNVITGTVRQVYYEINARDRVEGLRRIFDYHLDFYGIIFCNTKAAVDKLAHQLSRMGYNAAALHGDITQNQREKILGQFRNKFVKILVATDVAARGIDVDDLTHVINFSLPQSPEVYVHRIGRTGRAGKKGISITFVIPSERRGLKFVEKVNSCKLEKRTFPTAHEIIKHKEENIKTIITGIIEQSIGKSSKFNAIAEDMLKEHHAGEVISALLRYNFKNELDFNSYTHIADSSDEDPGPDRPRSRWKKGRSSPRSGSGKYKKRVSEKRQVYGDKKKPFKKPRFGNKKKSFKR